MGFEWSAFLRICLKKSLEAAKTTLWAGTAISSSLIKVTSKKSWSCFKRLNDFEALTWKSFHFKQNFSMPFQSWSLILKAERVGSYFIQVSWSVKCLILTKMKDYFKDREVLNLSFTQESSQGLLCLFCIKTFWCGLLCKSFLLLTCDIKLVWQKLYASKQTCQPKISYLNYVPIYNFDCKYRRQCYDLVDGAYLVSLVNIQSNVTCIKTLMKYRYTNLNTTKYKIKLKVSDQTYPSRVRVSIIYTLLHIKWKKSWVF